MYYMLHPYIIIIKGMYVFLIFEEGIQQKEKG